MSENKKLSFENEFTEDLADLLAKYGLKRDSIQEIKIDVEQVHCPMVTITYCMRNGVQKQENFKIGNSVNIGSYQDSTCITDATR